MENKEQNPCKPEKAQQGDQGGPSWKCRWKVFTGKVSCRVREKGRGKVTNLCTQGANHTKNYLLELKGQWGTVR